MSLLKLGVFHTSNKKDEKRLPIHPDQISWIDQEIRDCMYFEKGYGKNFGLSDEELEKSCAGVLSHQELIEHSEVALLPKPTPEDFSTLNDHTIHWGWPHCVQQYEMTQIAIDKKLTLIAWEAMHKWSKSGDWQMHIFHKNNEIAGYAGVMHAMNLRGIDGNYGPARKAVVFSFGSVSRGALRALQARGIHDINVYTQRHYILVADQMPGINYYQFDEDESGQLVGLEPNGDTYPFIEGIADADIIVNGVLQDTDHPMMFVSEGQEKDLKPGCIIIDISCDEGMGFHFAKPTTFSSPMFDVGRIHYYAVDHTPSYLWGAATWEISNSLIPYLPYVMGGKEKWEESDTLMRAIEIEEGMIMNPKILTFQNRLAAYPHPIKS